MIITEKIFPALLVNHQYLLDKSWIKTSTNPWVCNNVLTEKSKIVIMLYAKTWDGRCRVKCHKFTYTSQDEYQILFLKNMDLKIVK
jgi:hypothetical protein